MSNRSHGGRFAWMPTYVDVLMRDTMRLSRAEFGSYWLLCLAYWTNRGPLPSDEDALRRLARVETRAEWRKVRPILAVFFEVSPDAWSHRFLDRELEVARAISMANSENGKRGARSRWDAVADGECHSERHSEDMATAMANGMAKRWPEQQTTSTVVSSFAIAQEETAASFPKLLETEAFKAAWSDWLAYRRESKLGKWKDRTVKAKLAEMASWGEAVAIESIRSSIANGWQGLFEPKVGGGRGGRSARTVSVPKETTDKWDAAEREWPGAA